jgi:hypothetical protein
MTWTKTTLTDEFVGESCCFADIDGDGTVELVAGDYWWKLGDEGYCRQFRRVTPAWLPEWTPKDRIDPFPTLRPGSGAPQYRDSMHDFAVDITGNGLPDIVWVGMHTNPIRWCENPGSDPTEEWAIHEISPRGVHESVVVADIRGDGTCGVVTVSKKPTVVWYEPSSDPRAPWQMHFVGEQGGDWHGLGVVDVNADGAVEIITPDFVYFAADDARTAWRSKAVKQVLEDGTVVDGLGDVFIVHEARFLTGSEPQLCSASPHGYGLWWWELINETSDEITYRRHSLPVEVSQTHAIQVMPARDDGVAKLFTGKRWHAHGDTGDVDPGGTPLLLQYSASAGNWENADLEVIDEDVGVGVKFDSRVLPHGEVQIAVANKRGVHMFTSTREEDAA